MNRYQITAMTVSAAGLIGIVGYEGYSATAYKDTGGILAVEGEENFVGDSEIIALGGASNETKDRPLG